MRAHLFFSTRYRYWTAPGDSGDLGVFRSIHNNAGAKIRGTYAIFFLGPKISSGTTQKPSRASVRMLEKCQSTKISPKSPDPEAP